MRKGIFKKYVRNRYNDGNVKGTIDIARHIELNTPFTGNVAYSQREFSYDNNLMVHALNSEFQEGTPDSALNRRLIRMQETMSRLVDRKTEGGENP